MKLNLVFLALVSLFLAPKISQAAITPVTFETGYTWNLKTAVITGVTSSTLDVAGLGPGVGISTDARKNVVGFKYSIYSTDGDCSYTISQTTKTYAHAPNAAVSAGAFNNQFPLGLAGLGPVIMTSPLSTIPAGLAYNGDWEAKVLNPVFNFENLNAGSVYYVYVEYGVPILP